MKSLPISMALLAGVVWGAPAAAAAPAPAGNTLSSRIASYFRVHQPAYSGSVLVARRGQIVYSAGYSLADRATGRRNATETVFQIGSVTKQFTAASIMQLQERGRLTTTDGVCTYISPCPGAWKAITLRHLLTHTSGIFNYTEAQDTPQIRAMLGRPVTATEIIGLIRGKPLNFPPGSQYRYSNTNYVLLARIVEKVSGLSFGAYLQQNIFGPAGMTHSYGPAFRAPANSAVSTTTSPSRTIVANTTIYFGAGGIWSTVRDLYRWDRALFGGKLVSSASLAEIVSPRIDMHAAVPQWGISQQFYGYGWVVCTQNGRPTLWHNGQTLGFRAENVHFPKDNIQIILLSNVVSTDVEGIAYDLAKIVFPAG